MTAMRAEERPAEMAAGVLGTPAAVRPEDSAVDRAAVRWTLPAPAAETGAYGHAPASVTAWQMPPGSENAPSTRSGAVGAGEAVGEGGSVGLTQAVISGRTVGSGEGDGAPASAATPPETAAKSTAASANCRRMASYIGALNAVSSCA